MLITQPSKRSPATLFADKLYEIHAINCMLCFTGGWPKSLVLRKNITEIYINITYINT